MKLKESFVSHKNKDDYMMIDASGKFAGIIHSNATAAFIAECLRTETTREEIIGKCSISMMCLKTMPQKVLIRL